MTQITNVKTKVENVPHCGDQPIPAKAGIGLRHPHIQEFLDNTGRRPWDNVNWLEIHCENYLDFGSPRVDALMAIANDYPISCHGVGLSLGSAQGVSLDHLDQWKTLFDMVKPDLVSDHLSWSITGGVYYNDLLPLPYTEEALDLFCTNVDKTQHHLNRQILVENPSSYISFTHSTISEWDFLAEISKRTGCGILLDLNNIYVSSVNHGFDAAAYLASMPADKVGEYHLAGHSHNILSDGTDLLVDTHSDIVCDEVWGLYDMALHLIGPRPTLIEWDVDIPSLDILVGEADKATAHMQGRDDIRHKDKVAGWHHVA